MGNWRWGTWLIVGWTVLMAVLCVAVIYPDIPNTPSYDPPPGGNTSAYQFGVACGASLIYWVMGMIILGPIWYFTRKRVMCPVCGNKVSPKETRCGRCGFVPGMPYPPQAMYPQQPGWPPQAQPPGWPPQPPQAQPPGWPPQPPQAQPPGWPPQPPQAQPPGWPPQPPQAQPPGWPPQPPQAPPPGWPPQPPQAPPPGWPPQPPQAPPPGWPPQPPQAPPPGWPPQPPAQPAPPSDE